MKLAPLFSNQHPPCDNEAQAAARQIVKELSGNVVHLEFKEDDRPPFVHTQPPTPERQLELGAGRIVLTKDEYLALRKDRDRLDQMEAEHVDVCERCGLWNVYATGWRNVVGKSSSVREAIDAAMLVIQQPKKS